MSYLVLVIYWILSVLSTYIVRYYNNKKHAYRKIFAEEVPLSKKILESLAIWLIMPLAMPFVLLYLLGHSIYTFIDKRKYKKRPRPVPKEKRSYLRKDTVFDETNTSMSLAEYNYKHGTDFNLDQIYGKGYEASLTVEEKADFKERNSKFGILRFGDGLLESSHTKAATILGNAMLSGDFEDFNSMLDNGVETTLYGNKTIVGKTEVAEYWKGWRDRFVVTKDVTEFEVIHSNHYSHSCLQMKTMLVLFMMKDAKIVRMILVSRHISGGYYSHHDDLVEDYPFNLAFINRYKKPLREVNEFNAPVIKEHRLPCFCCGAKSETLEWYSTQINIGIHGYPGIVSICPKCGKVVEYVTEGRYRLEKPVVDEYDMLEEYANCWNNLSIGELENYLSDDFHYSSHWVFEELDKAGYIGYFTKQLQRIAESGSNVKAKLVNKLLVVSQEGNNVVISVKFKDGKIERADMSPASFYGIPNKELVTTPRFNLMGLRNFFNDCPLKGTKYVDKIGDDLTARIMDYDKLRNGDSDPYTVMSLKQVAEDCEWMYLGHLTSEDKDSLEIIKSCYIDAVNDGLYEAANNLGVLAFNYEDNPIEGNKWLNHAAAHGSQNAMINQFTIHWSNEEYLEGTAMLSNMFNKKTPSLKCLWNLAYLYYMGDNCPHNTIKQDTDKAKQILSMIADFDKNLICEQEKEMPRKAKQMLDYINSANIYSDKAVEYHKLLRTSVIKTASIKNKGEVFSTLSSLELVPDYNLGLRLANGNTSDIGDESNFYVYNDSGVEDAKILSYLSANPTPMSAWQVYLLMTSPTVMPVFWHGGYIIRDFIFNESNLDEISHLQNLDLSAIKNQGLLFPSVNIEKEESTDRTIAHVFCCYWNEWKGLVREHATVVFDGNCITDFQQEDLNIFYPYDCGICF